MKNRILSILLSLILVFSTILSVSSFAATPTTPTFTIEADKATANRGDTINYTIYLQQPDTMVGFAFYIKVSDGLTLIDESVTLDEAAMKLFDGEYEYTSPKETLKPSETLPYVSWLSEEFDDFTNNNKIKLVSFQCRVNDDAQQNKLHEINLEQAQIMAGSTQDYADISSTIAVTPHFVYVSSPVSVAPKPNDTKPSNPQDTPDNNDDKEEPQTPPTTEKDNNPFKDVATGLYYYNPVLWAVEKNITAGTSENTFSPDLSCTRGQTVTFLWRAAGCPTPTLTENPFEDVKPGSYYYDAVLWAVEKGITTGMSETSFSPDATVNRAQTVTFLWRFAEKSEVTAANPFKDVAAGQYFEKAVLWAANQGITTGTSETTFSPESECTRGQIVTFIYRYFN